MSESKDAGYKALEDRINYLEEQNAGLKRVGGLALALILLIGGLFVSQVWKDLRGLASGGLVLLNNERREVAALTVTPRGNVAVVPVNFGGTPSLQLDHLPFNGIGIYDSQGRLRLLFGTTPDGDKAVVGCLNDAGQPIWTPLADLKAPAVAPGQPAPGTKPVPAPSGTPVSSGSPAPNAPASSGTPVAAPTTQSPVPAATPAASGTPSASTPTPSATP